MRFTELSAADPAAARTAAEHLAVGGLLAHPTSSVYGIGGGPDPAMAPEVGRLKGRPPGPGFVHLVADVEGLRRGFPAAAWPALAARLAEAFWPGPLTLVLDDGSANGVAVRAEPHGFTRSVLRRFHAPLGSSSLNRTGEPPAADPAAARRVLEELPASDRPVLFVDAGPLPGPPPSTLVRVPGTAGRAFDIVRPGAIDIERIAAVAVGTQACRPSTDADGASAPGSDGEAGTSAR